MNPLAPQLAPVPDGVSPDIAVYLSLAFTVALALREILVFLESRAKGTKDPKDDQAIGFARRMVDLVLAIFGRGRPPPPAAP